MDKTPARITQNNHTPGSSAGKTMSSALKARLKRARPSFTSPFSVVKRLNIDDDDDDEEIPQNREEEEEEDQTGPPEEAETDVNRNETVRDSNISHLSHSELVQLREKLQKDVKQKTETLRRLRMVKMYRKKNDLTQLQDLTDKWRNCAQAVLYQLQTELNTDGRKACLSQLIDSFGLEDRILHFDRTEEDFTDS